MNMILVGSFGFTKDDDPFFQAEAFGDGGFRSMFARGKINQLRLPHSYEDSSLKQILGGGGHGEGCGSAGEGEYSGNGTSQRTWCMP